MRATAAHDWGWGRARATQMCRACPPPRLGLGGPDVREGIVGPRRPGLGGLGGNEGRGAGRGLRRLRPPGPLLRRLLGGRGRHRDRSLRRRG
eukprot:1314511-Prorocentrum_lima.AAC.1